MSDLSRMVAAGASGAGLLLTAQFVGGCHPLDSAKLRKENDRLKENCTRTNHGLGATPRTEAALPSAGRAIFSEGRATQLNLAAEAPLASAVYATDQPIPDGFRPGPAGQAPASNSDGSTIVPMRTSDRLSSGTPS